MLSRKKTRTELSKPGEVQGKYVKKETSPLLRNLMPSFIRHGPTIPRRTDICLPDSSSSAYSAGGDGIVSRNQSFLRTPVQRPPHEIMRRESNRLSAPSYLARNSADVPREYGSSSQSFLTEANSVTENGDAGTRYYYDFYDGQRRHQLSDRVHENYRYYGHNNDLFQRMSQNQGRHTGAEPIISMDICPLEWWLKPEGTCKSLARLACKYLVMPATTVPCEHLFIMSPESENKKWATLSPANVNKFVCLSDWLNKK
uniref:HAT C-terminal dimerisation domain-containing protein n=1 Tax=Gopherus agassizii TaxID=38772 RepID=A0A452H594_9SAUR